MSDGPTLTELYRRLAEIGASLEEEVQALPGQILAYGRPHANARTRHFLRYSPSGVQLQGSVRIGPDCPRPVRGRCECPPDGSWRPSPGSLRADSLASHLELGQHGWFLRTYVRGSDGLWRCVRPTRRALQRLQAQNVTSWAVLQRLLRGVHLSRAWGAAGTPPDAVGRVVAMCRQVERWAKEEAQSEWEYRPGQVSWIDKSEAQRQAEAG